MEPPRLGIRDCLLVLRDLDGMSPWRELWEGWTWVLDPKPTQPQHPEPRVPLTGVPDLCLTLARILAPPWSVLGQAITPLRGVLLLHIPQHIGPLVRRFQSPLKSAGKLILDSSGQHHMTHDQSPHKSNFRLPCSLSPGKEYMAPQAIRPPTLRIKEWLV